jgi:hypothetical protein
MEGLHHSPDTFQEACQVASPGRLAPTGPMQVNALRSADVMTSSVCALRHTILLRHEVTSCHVWDLIMAETILGPESPDYRPYFIIIDFQ